MADLINRQIDQLLAQGNTIHDIAMSMAHHLTKLEIKQLIADKPIGNQYQSLDAKISRCLELIETYKQLQQLEDKLI